MLASQRLLPAPTIALTFLLINTFQVEVRVCVRCWEKPLITNEYPPPPALCGVDVDRWVEQVENFLLSI